MAIIPFPRHFIKYSSSFKRIRAEQAVVLRSKIGTLMLPENKVYKGVVTSGSLNSTIVQTLLNSAEAGASTVCLVSEEATTNIGNISLSVNIPEQSKRTTPSFTYCII